MKYIFILLFCSIGYSQGVANNPFVTFPESGIDLTDLIALYQFESNLNDSYGSYNGTAYGTPTYTTGKVGNCIVTTQTPDGGEVADADIFSIGTAGTDKSLSVSVWVNDNGSGDVRGWLVNKRGANSNTQLEWQLIYYDVGFYFEVYDGGNTNRIGRRTTTTLTGSTWYHVVATYDASESASGINIYVNGSDADTTDSNAGTYTGSTNTTGEIFIGLPRGLVASNAWAGYIDEVSIWNKELTASEVSEIYTIENGGAHITD